MTIDIAQGVTVAVNLLLIFFIVRSNTVVKQRLKSQDDINAKMKSFMDIFSVDELRKFVEVRTETMQLKLENYIHKENKKFANNAEPYLRNMLDKEIENVVENIEEKYNEICDVLYIGLLSLPKDKRPEFIEKHLKITGEDFIHELKLENEWPTTSKHNTP